MTAHVAEQPLTFAEELHEQRWDDHRYYHRSRVNQRCIRLHRLFDIHHKRLHVVLDLDRMNRLIRIRLSECGHCADGLADVFHGLAAVTQELNRLDLRILLRGAGVDRFNGGRGVGRNERRPEAAFCHATNSDKLGRGSARSSSNCKSRKVLPVPLRTWTW